MSKNGEDPKGIDRDTVRRVWAFSRPYRKMVAVFVVLIIIAAVVGIIPPFVFGDILDTAIPQGQQTGDSSRLTLSLIHI